MLNGRQSGGKLRDQDTRRAWVVLTSDSEILYSWQNEEETAEKGGLGASKRRQAMEVSREAIGTVRWRSGEEGTNSTTGSNSSMCFIDRRRKSRPVNSTLPLYHSNP